MAEARGARGSSAAPDFACWRAVLPALLFGGLLAAAAFVAYRGRAEFGDEGSFCTIAQGVLRGGLPYRDLFNEKPPLQYFWTAAVMALGGSTLTGARLASAVVLALTAGCIVLGPLWRRANAAVVLSVMLATALVALRLEAYRNTADSTLALFGALSAALLSRDAGNPRTAAWLGGLQGLALGFRQAAAAPALVLLFSPRLKGARWAFAAGLLAGLLAWLIPFATTGLLWDLVKATILFHVGNSGAAGYLGGHVDYRASLLVWLLLVAAVALASRRSRGERAWALVWLVIAALAYFGRKEEFRLWPSAAAALALLAWEEPEAGPATGFATLRTAGMLAVAALVAGFSAFRHPPPRGDGVESVATALRSASRPDEPVWAGPFLPYAYCLAERRPASRYYFVLPWTAKPEIRAEIVRDILAKRPVIVIDRSGFDVDKMVPEIEPVLAAHYHPVVAPGMRAQRHTIYRPN